MRARAVTVRAGPAWPFGSSTLSVGASPAGRPGGRGLNPGRGHSRRSGLRLDFLLRLLLIGCGSLNERLRGRCGHRLGRRLHGFGRLCRGRGRCDLRLFCRGRGGGLQNLQSQTFLQAGRGGRGHADRGNFLHCPQHQGREGALLRSFARSRNKRPPGLGLATTWNVHVVLIGSGGSKLRLDYVLDWAGILASLFLNRAEL